MVSLFGISRLFCVAVLVVCVVILATVLMMQYVFGIVPCVLCVYERIPYLVAGIIAAVGSARCCSARLRKGCVAVLAGVFLSGVALGIYHAGVERSFWVSAVCAGGLMRPETVADMIALAGQPISPPCAEVRWTMFGLSLADYNALVSTMLLGGAGMVLARGRGTGKGEQRI